MDRSRSHPGPPWVWELPLWPSFTWDDGTLEGYVARFARDVAWQAGGITFIGGDDLIEVHLDWLTDEAAETSAIEGESLQRDSIRASMQHFFGLRPSPDAPGAEQGVARVTVEAHRSFDEPLSHEMLQDWHLSLMSHSPTIRQLGTYRAGPEPAQIVTVRRGSVQDAKLHYLAPPGTRVAAEMDAFVDWYNEATRGVTERQALSVSGVAHLYFECIHPFEDGNGRIGRLLAEKALARCLGRPSMIPLSTIIHARRPDYYRALDTCRHSLDARQWQAWFADTVLEALAAGRLRLVRHAAQTRMFDTLKGRMNPRQELALRRLFREEPRGFEGGLSSANYQSITGAASATATRDLSELVRLGALRRTGSGRHTRYWLNAPQLDEVRANPGEPGSAERPGHREGRQARSPSG